MNLADQKGSMPTTLERDCPTLCGPNDRRLSGVMIEKGPAASVANAIIETCSEATDSISTEDEL